VNVIDVLNEKNIKFLMQGNDYVVHCLNPEHEDIHPSMKIDKISGVFHCFSCKYKGNIFKYFGKKLGPLDYRTNLIKAKIANLLFSQSLEIPKDAKPFVEKYRGISPEIFKTFSAFTTSEIEDMEDRIIFPITNLTGDIKCFIGRFIFSDAKPKYKIYPSKISLPLFPAHPLMIDNSIILVEGIFDMLNLYDKGLYNAVTAFGTDALTKKSINKINYYEILGVHKVYIMFDGDDAGRDSAEKLERLLHSRFMVDIIELPDGRDPGDLELEEVKHIKGTIYEGRSS
jgi:DNA primase